MPGGILTRYRLDWSTNSKPTVACTTMSEQQKIKVNYDFEQTAKSYCKVDTYLYTDEYCVVVGLR